MNLFTKLFLWSAVVGAMAWRGADASAETPEIILETHSKDFISFSGSRNSLTGSIPTDKLPASTPDHLGIESFNVTFKSFPAGMQEMPEAKFEIQGTRYIIPARKIFVPGPHPDDHGVHVESVLDPNGSGNFEVVIVINWLATEFDKLEIDDKQLPKGVEVVNNSASWSTTEGEKRYDKWLIFRNESGQPFIVKPELFKGLPDATNWPVMEIPPVTPKV